MVVELNNSTLRGSDDIVSHHSGRGFNFHFEGNNRVVHLSTREYSKDFIKRMMRARKDHLEGRVRSLSEFKREHKEE